MTDADDAALARFAIAQADTYDRALDEIRDGRKRTHWIWYVFPQLRGLGTSATSARYALQDLRGARRYLAHPLLGPRLRKSVDAMLSHPRGDAEAILGALDAMKFRSSLSLFARAAPDGWPFDLALARFFDGRPDPRTPALLNAQDRQGDA